MTVATRIYIITFGDTTRLIRATTKSQAVRHVADDVIKAAVATQDDLVSALAKSIKVEVANEEPVS